MGGRFCPVGRRNFHFSIVSYISLRFAIIDVFKRLYLKKFISRQN